MDKAGLFLTWAQLLYIGVVLVLFYVAELLFMWFRHRKNTPPHIVQDSSARIEALEQEIELLKIRVAAISAMPRVNNPSSSQIDELSDAAESGDSLYAQAIRMAQSGADAPKLVDECGLSRAEADLIVAIYHGVYKG
ncbi:DUF2802 domain-containing protein [Chitinibacter bivalviorum]|uniref:DUF2802 domain-containing protein n=1 Tax=Chitinibacter bivalviorum TaxID=2739434 RepID=A0A7H9BG48_9NEIS|nr:DUF2802 domain-containing protein [Chitinibacter bivalviorum]QLG87402.1 DUF2802 domain-containing protein [Chitinibacter bivalviorum]